MEKGKEFYDNAYKTGGNKKMYAKHYAESPYLKVWEKSIELITNMDDPKIIEIGCGVGQYANLLFDHGIYDYKGFDFSDEAIRQAKRTNSKYSESFFVDDAYTSVIYEEDYNVAIIFEVLEHLNEDLFVLDKIKKGAKVLFSVPSFDTESHVRHFKTKSDVINRYSDLIDIEGIYPFILSPRTGNIIYLGYGVKK